MFLLWLKTGLASGDYIDLKMYESAMRHLLDTYILADESETLSAFDDMTLVQLVVERGEAAVDSLPDGIRENSDAVLPAAPCSMIQGYRGSLSVSSALLSFPI